LLREIAGGGKSETLRDEQHQPGTIDRPRVFIGSSTEGLAIAEAIQLGLDSVAECTLWTQATFQLGQATIESVVDASLSFDFAILVLTPDDSTDKRGNIAASPRDNILFELGLFTGTLGRARTFIRWQCTSSHRSRVYSY
jgi:predicted nucleotide-binding protein